MKTIIECRRNLDFNTLGSESFAYMLKGDIQRAKKDYEDEYNQEFDTCAKVEIDYDYSPQPIDRVIHFDNLIEEAKKAFESLKESKNFAHAEGWNIEYEVDDKKKKILYGVSIAITFDEEHDKKVKENQTNTENKIREFYADNR